MRQIVRETALGIVMLLLSALLWIETLKPQYLGNEDLNYGFPPSFYPRILLSIWAALSVLIVARAWMTPSTRVFHARWKRAATAVALTAAFLAAITQVGFLLASVPFMAAFMVALGYRRPVAVVLIALIFSVAGWWIMTGPLQITLPKSPWFQAF